MRHKDLLHTVNNQLEIITSAAELLNLRSSDRITQDLCSKIQSAVLNTPTALAHYIRGRMSEEQSIEERDGSSNPAAAKRAILLSPTVE
jgi:two-component sensor histidine kinase